MSVFRPWIDGKIEVKGVDNRGEREMLEDSEEVEGGSRLGRNGFRSEGRGIEPSPYVWRRSGYWDG